MNKLYNWSIKRSGNAMTVTHSTGKVADIMQIDPLLDGRIVATDKRGNTYELITKYDGPSN